jgi:hypothetical protein
LSASDNPIAFLNSLAGEDKRFMRPGAKVYFPLNSNSLLYPFDMYSQQKYNKDKLSNMEINEANETQIRSSSLQISKNK